MINAQESLAIGIERMDDLDDPVTQGGVSFKVIGFI